jgi:hypothetical protein
MSNKSLKDFFCWLREWSELISLFVAVIMLWFLFWQIKAATNAQIVNNLITLNQQMYPCQNFNNILMDIANGKKLLEKNGGKYLQFEIDNFLGYFEMLGIVEERGYLDTEIIDDMFGYDVENILKNKEIQAYIKNDKKATWPFLKQLGKNIALYNR